MSLLLTVVAWVLALVSNALSLAEDEETVASVDSEADSSASAVRSLLYDE